MSTHQPTSLHVSKITNMLCCYLISVLVLFHVVECLDVKIGFLFPHDSALRGYLTNKIGFSTSAGAVAVAVERIEKEGILPGANIS